MKKFAFQMALLLPNVLLSGFVLSRLWNWFVVPAFGLRSMGTAMMIGVCLTIAFATVKLDSKEGDSETMDDIFIKSVTRVALSALVLGAGRIIRMFL